MKLLCATVALFAAGSLADDADWKESVAVLDGDSFEAMPVIDERRLPACSRSDSAIVGKRL